MSNKNFARQWTFVKNNESNVSKTFSGSITSQLQETLPLLKKIIPNLLPTPPPHIPQTITDLLNCHSLAFRSKSELKSSDKHWVSEVVFFTVTKS